MFRFSARLSARLGAATLMLVLLVHPSLLGAAQHCTGKRKDCDKVCCRLVAKTQPQKPSCHLPSSAAAQPAAAQPEAPKPTPPCHGAGSQAASYSMEAACGHSLPGWTALPPALLQPVPLAAAIVLTGRSILSTAPVLHEPLLALDAPPPRSAPLRS
jgi:hypothetical protein